MAKLKLIKEENKNVLTLNGCSYGDLVSIPQEEIVLGIIMDDDCSWGCTKVADLDDGSCRELPNTTRCRKYTGTIEINATLFEDFEEE